MIRLPLLVLGIVLAASGGLELAHAARSREQASTTCAEMAQAPDQARWIRATGCEIDYMGATWRETRGQIHELFLPVQPAGQSPSAPIRIVVATTDPEVLAVAQGTVGDGRRADPESFTVMGLRIVTILKASREIDGYARHGVLDRLMARRALAGFGSALAPDFIVVDLHARPPLAFPVVLAAAGVAAFAGFVFAGRRRRPAGVDAEPATAEAAPAIEPQPLEPRAVAPESPTAPALAMAAVVAPGLPPPVEPVRATVLALPVRPAPPTLPAMMFLNLPASASADAIERAPALGSREEVVARISRALPGIHFDAGGRATWTGHDWSLAISIDSQDPVWTVTVQARGSAAAELAERLAARTGWRVYVPRRGAFLFDEAKIEG